MNKSWPVEPNHYIAPRSPAIRGRRAGLAGFPRSGKGDRALNCDQYELCLDFAIVKDWESFHCQDCGYKHKGPINFFASEFEGIEEVEEGVLTCTESELEMLIEHHNEQEDFILTLIEKGFLNG